MQDLESGAAMAGADTKVRAVALAGLAATLTAPAGAAIVSVTDLDRVIQPGESYYLPGIPYLEFQATKHCIDKACNLTQTWGLMVGHNTFEPDGPKSIMVSGALFSWQDVPVGALIGPVGTYGAHDWSPTNYQNYIIDHDATYKAIRFTEGGKDHYGWINFSAPGWPPAGGSSAGDFVIHGFGYNDEAGAPIHVGETASAVPEPDTLALLAAGVIGAAAGSARRRRAQR